MYSSTALKRVKSQEQQACLPEAELKAVKQAREESRKEVANLERMKQYARAAFLSGSAATEEEFEQCWPEMRNYLFRLQAHHGAVGEWRAQS